MELTDKMREHLLANADVFGIGDETSTDDGMITRDEFEDMVWVSDDVEEFCGFFAVQRYAAGRAESSDETDVIELVTKLIGGIA